MDLHTPDQVLTRLKAAGIWSKKRLGQHFLLDAAVLDAAINSANLQSEDIVVEIGPGMGVLSRQLLARASRVIAFEYDSDMVALLKADLPGLEVIPGDVLDTALPIVKSLGRYKIVANIPYQITTPLLRLFLEGEYVPFSMTLLVQKEVGKRLTAPAGSSDRGYLSVLAEYFSAPSYVISVPKEAFFPPPKVESAVIHLESKAPRAFRGEEERKFLKFVRMLFINPRKQLKNVVAGIKGMPSAEVEELFARHGVSRMARAQELTLEQWQGLFNDRIGGGNG